MHAGTTSVSCRNAAYTPDIPVCLQRYGLRFETTQQVPSKLLQGIEDGELLSFVQREPSFSTLSCPRHKIKPSETAKMRHLLCIYKRT
jgi:hypothetical protein